MRLISILFVGFVLAIGTGCSFSRSSGSISDSISSPSKSSSASSSGGDEDEAKPEAAEDAASYGEDVSQLAFTYAKNGGDIGALRSAVSGLAAKRGITNWEVDSATSRAIGSGIAKGGMQEDDFAKFSKELFGEDVAKQAALREGYQPNAQPAAVSAAPAGSTTEAETPEESTTEAETPEESTTEPEAS